MVEVYEPTKWYKDGESKAKGLDIIKLCEGDIVQNLGSGEAYIVTGSYGKDIKIGVKSITITNPQEWKLIMKGVHVKEDNS